MGREKVSRRYLFVGENRSKKAQENGWTWQSCQKGERLHLCAIQLSKALSFSGLDFQRQEVTNLWNDKGELIRSRRKKLLESGLPVVGMGQKVQKQLETWDINHIPIVHPAARGIWRRQEIYNRHVRTKLR